LEDNMGIENIISAPLIYEAKRAASQQQPSTLNTVLDILGSKGGQTLVGAAGAGLQAYQQSKDAAAQRAELQANRAQSANQFAANTIQRQSEDDRNLQLDQAKSAAAMSPLGESQMFAQRNAILLPLLQGARNFKVTPGDAAVAAAMGSGPTGGIRLPEGGLDPAMLAAKFGDAATLESIKNRQQAIGQINPNMVAQDLSPMYGQAGANATADITVGNQDLAAKQEMATMKQRDQIMRAIDEDIKGEKRGPAPKGYEYDKKTGELKKKGGGFLSTLGKIASIAAPIAAAPFTGGTSLALIGAGAGAANGLLSGGGLKGALMGAGMGAIPGMTGAGKAASAVAPSLTAGMKAAAKNPALYSAILGMR
jgi:hypothetical protein